MGTPQAIVRSSSHVIPCQESGQLYAPIDLKHTHHHWIEDLNTNAIDKLWMINKLTAASVLA